MWPFIKRVNFFISIHNLPTLMNHITDTIAFENICFTKYVVKHNIICMLSQLILNFTEGFSKYLKKCGWFWKKTHSAFVQITFIFYQKINLSNKNTSEKNLRYYFKVLKFLLVLYIWDIVQKYFLDAK